MTTLRSLVGAMGLLLVFLSPLSAESDGQLHAFANPLPSLLTFADHTWVTDYPSQLSCPDPNANYWYCAGACHPSESDEAPRPLLSADADLGMAMCIAQPNERTFNPGPATARIRAWRATTRAATGRWGAAWT